VVPAVISDTHLPHMGLAHAAGGAVAFELVVLD
jgi:hypothetical protein